MRVSVSVLPSTLGSQWSIARDVDREGAAVGVSTCSAVRSTLRGRSVGSARGQRAGSAVDATRARGDCDDAQKRVVAVVEVAVSVLRVGVIQSEKVQDRRRAVASTGLGSRCNGPEKCDRAVAEVR